MVFSVLVIVEVFFVYTKLTFLMCVLLNAIIFSSLAIVNCVIMWILLVQLNKMKEETWHSEKKKIQHQFIFFTIAYVLRAALELVAFVLLQHEHDDNFALNFVSFAFIIPSDVLPITYVLWVHNKIYSRMTTQATVPDESVQVP